MIVDTNVNGPLLMARAVVPRMIEQHWGRIINISINHETMRRARFSPHGPSKAAVESETIIWARTWPEPASLSTRYCLAALPTRIWCGLILDRRRAGSFSTRTSWSRRYSSR